MFVFKQKDKQKVLNKIKDLKKTFIIKKVVTKYWVRLRAGCAQLTIRTCHQLR
jgi:hypothetical protein